MKLSRASLLLALLPLPAPALDLTPTPSFRELEGMKIPIILFQDADKKVAFQPPANWRVTGDETSLSLYPAEPVDALFQLRLRPRKPVEPGAVEDVEKWCRSQLPPDALEPVLEREAASPFLLDSRPSREFTYSYAALGRRFTTAVAIVDWDESKRLVVIVTSRTADFPGTHEVAMRSMFSWNPQP